MWWRWFLYSMWPFSFSSFKSPLMLSMLLSVEELESLIIPYCHVFENHLHFLFFTSVSLQLLLIVIKPWFQSFLKPSSTTSSSSCCCFIFYSFFLFREHKMYWNTTLDQSPWNYISNEPPFAWNGFRTRELCPFYSGDAICNFHNVQRPMFMSYLLVWVFKFIDIRCVGIITWWSYRFWTFLPLYISEHMLKPWWK
jgi:hypothetical protein